MSEETNCPSCGWRSYARIDQQIADGSFAPGPYVRCIQCKREWMLPLPPPPDAGEVRTYREGASSEWRPIETAPKDGTDILVWSDCYTDPTTYGGMFIAWWADIHAPDSEYGTVQHDAHWCWCTEIDGKNGPAKVRSQPTHWMPLPAPPAAAIRKLP